MTTMAADATARTSTITEVSICKPCHVMATSPGRSASHVRPTAKTPTTTRNSTTRIIAGSDSWGEGAERLQRMGGELSGRVEGGLARPRRADP